MCLTFHIGVVHFFGMLKEKSIYTKYLCLLSQNFFAQAYVIFAPKLDVPKIGILLSKCPPPPRLFLFKLLHENKFVKFVKLSPLKIKSINPMFLCYYPVTYGFQSESTLYSLPECQGTPCSKQAPYLKFK